MIVHQTNFMMAFRLWVLAAYTAKLDAGTLGLWQPESLLFVHVFEVGVAVQALFVEA
jgi:hypothetical protein